MNAGKALAFLAPVLALVEDRDDGPTEADRLTALLRIAADIGGAVSSYESDPGVLVEAVNDLAVLSLYWLGLLRDGGESSAAEEERNYDVLAEGTPVWWNDTKCVVISRFGESYGLRMQSGAAIAARVHRRSLARREADPAAVVPPAAARSTPATSKPKKSPPDPTLPKRGRGRPRKHPVAAPPAPASVVDAVARTADLPFERAASPGEPGNDDELEEGALVRWHEIACVVNRQEPDGRYSIRYADGTKGVPHVLRGMLERRAPIPGVDGGKLLIDDGEKIERVDDLEVPADFEDAPAAPAALAPRTLVWWNRVACVVDGYDATTGLYEISYVRSVSGARGVRGVHREDLRVRDALDAVGADGKAPS